MTVTPVLSTPSALTSGRTGFVHAAVRTDQTDLVGWSCHTAGPTAMIEALQEVVLVLGLRRHDLHADVFLTSDATAMHGDLVAAG